MNGLLLGIEVGERVGRSVLEMWSGVNGLGSCKFLEMRRTCVCECYEYDLKGCFT